ncbi:RsmB/NOP family class I SAM-dependent RNA methyltransferase [Treponema saccharophilum]|uniref:Fmu (Sun) domain protein n=2 Tax=Treponema TaxID=157 RepID=H7EJZ7_9SPIR|nr:RsmB/NOP family class I SAM-dependent RNA methyltransferase [Treponema saccharophilum]EIC02084.1 Fmu (Sun) domain protein [Treponema saccharophilum DSM 2985]BDC96274.1 SAM-dependent methyltransferase [Treponema saccharophilum]
MKQKDRIKKLSGADGFDSYYREIYGERWDGLKNALSGEADHMEFNAGGASPYFLDSGSIRCAVSLPLSGAERILDMCAAPGGKTIVIASCMDVGATLLSNERSPERKARLVRSCDSCLPGDVRSRVEICCKDGAKMCLSKENEGAFDRILLDAPCSSERHVLADPKYLGEWSPSRIKTLAVAQWSLLSSAYRMLAPGGYLLYSTCALAAEENDGVVSRLVRKFPDARIVPPAVSSDVSGFCSGALPDAEKTEFGFHVLPDAQGGAGPLFFSLIYKNEMD